jgi:hypothetical protein
MSDLPYYLPGIPPLYNVKQASLEFAQGSDITIQFPLTYNGDPLTDTTDWTLTTYVKKSNKAANVLWTGSVDSVTSNIYSFTIQASDNATTVPGTYFWTVKGILAGEDTKTLIMAEGTFAVILDASSPNPKVCPGGEYTEPVDGPPVIFTGYDY